jgi:hypothetical protein
MWAEKADTYTDTETTISRIISIKIIAKAAVSL